MSTTAIGRLTDEDGQPRNDFTVEVRDLAWLFDLQLGEAKSAADGRFSVSCNADALAPEFGLRLMHLRVYDEAPSAKKTGKIVS